ncbi:MAG: hypothetical protein CMB55_08650 [Euryarchaeota archaeon]|nr:hypothetical protein [Euryarchaeota archaeon]
MSSSRLPGKVLKPLAGEPMLFHIYTRLLQCKHIDKVIVATSNDRSDDEIENFCIQKNFNLYRGSLNNVLSRYINLINQYDCKYYVRVTGDCPFIYPQFIDAQIQILKKHNADVLWFKNESSLLEGQGVFSSKSLKFISKLSNDDEDKEHVGSIYLANNPHCFKIVEMRLPSQLLNNDFRLTVDEEEDYEFAKHLYDHYKNKLPINFVDLISYLKGHKYLGNINGEIKHRSLNVDLFEKRKKWVHAKKIGCEKFKLY